MEWPKERTENKSKISLDAIDISDKLDAMKNGNDMKLPFIYNDGGRAKAGYAGATRDCVTRAIAIATGKPYQEVYDSLNELSQLERKGKRKKGVSNSRTGVYRRSYEKYLNSLGWEFIPTMGIGTGVTVHLRQNELPNGKIICRCSRHLVAVVDGAIYDTEDPSRNGERAVYGYFRKTL
jgi:hypothetical protein